MVNIRLFSRLLSVLLLIAVLLPPPASAFTSDGPPFSLPFADPPGPTTWLFEQPYGNTTSAYNFASEWYINGQGLHFGIDLEAPCRTPVLAIADGVVAYIDADGFGAGPHNLILDHPGTGYSSLYGHLYELPRLRSGQTVRRGEQIGLSGDPDGSCKSRPHLHLEIRSADYQIAYNPLPFFEVNWQMLASFGPFSNSFQQDLDAPRRWMQLDDQPSVHFGDDLLNDYLHPWPPRLEVRPPINPPPTRRLDTLPEEAAVTREQVSPGGRWNGGAWWRPPDLDAVYVIDALPGQEARVYRQPLNGSRRQSVEAVPPTLYSPDGTVSVQNNRDGSFQITSGDQSWEVFTDGNYPAVSPGNTRLLWEVVYGEIVPGTRDPGLSVWVSNLDGTRARSVYTQSGGYSLWLDDHRLLIVQRVPYRAETRLYVLDLDDPTLTPYELGRFRYLRGLQVAPGGEHITFFLPFQENPDDSGLYIMRTCRQCAARQLPFVGSTRWRDDRSLYALSFDPSTDVHTLGVYDVRSDTYRILTDAEETPIRVANNEWSVSPDGTRIVYLDPTDDALYLLTVGIEAPEEEQ